MPVVVNTPPSGRLTCQQWATVDDVGSPCNAYDADLAKLDLMLDAASDILFSLAGRQFPGLCVATVRPCAQLRPGVGGRPFSGYRPGYDGGYGYNGMGMPVGWQASWGECQCNSTIRSGCTNVPEITLGVDSLVGIIAVKVDGVDLAPSQYRIDDSRWLVRLPDPDGSRPGWPTCQDVVLGSDQPGTFEVTFTHGRLPPPMGVQAAATLACQLYLAATPAKKGECKLPQRVTSITRSGVTALVLDPFLMLDKGKTGLYEVDLFLRSVNPGGLTREAAILSPDSPARVRRAGQ